MENRWESLGHLLGCLSGLERQKLYSSLTEGLDDPDNDEEQSAMELKNLRSQPDKLNAFEQSMAKRDSPRPARFAGGSRLPGPKKRGRSSPPPSTSALKKPNLGLPHNQF